MEEEVTLEEIVTDLTEKVSDFIESFVASKVEQNLLITPLYESEEFGNLDLTPETSDYKDSTNLINEITLSDLLADLINLGTVDNGYNKSQIAVLLDLSFYLKYHEKANYDLPHTLLVLLIKETPCEWLLEFWPYLDKRVSIFKKYKNNGDKLDFISPIRAVGIPLMIALNTRLNNMKYSCEPQRDILRAKILKFSSDIFPLFEKQLVNKKFETNHERDNETKFEYIRDRNEEVYNAFWYLQRTFQDPFEVFSKSSAKTIRNIQDDLLLVVQEIRQIELAQGAKPNLKIQDAEPDNRASTYFQTDLPQSKREELQKFYDEKDFNPSFLVSKQKFKLQFKNDPFMRRVMLTQIFILCGFLEAVVHIPALRTNDGGKGPNQKLKNLIKDVGAIGFFTKLKRDVLEVFQSIEKRLLFVCFQYRDFSENYYLHSKVEGFKNFNQEVSTFEINDEFKQVLEARIKYKPKFWAKYGTAPISRHWTIETGLEKLKKDISSDEIDTKLKQLRFDIKNRMDEDTSSEIQVKELLNWKALRLARKNNLFKFKQVNEVTGLEGIYDPSLKVKYDETKAKEEQERLKKELLEKEQRIKDREEREAKESELNKQEEERQRVVAEELEKKRKASQELFDEESKRIKLGSTGATISEDGTILDY